MAVDRCVKLRLRRTNPAHDVVLRWLAAQEAEGVPCTQAIVWVLARHAERLGFEAGEGAGAVERPVPRRRPARSPAPGRAPGGASWAHEEPAPVEEGPPEPVREAGSAEVTEDARAPRDGAAPSVEPHPVWRQLRKVRL